MTFAAVGSLIQEQGSSTFTLTPGGVGDLILLEVVNYGETSSAYATGLSSSNVTWTPMGTPFTGSVNTGLTAAVFAGKVTSTSPQTVTITWSGTDPTPHESVTGQEFSVTAGSWALDVQAHLDNSGTNTWPSLTPAGNGELYFGYAVNDGAASDGTTSGYVYQSDADSNGLAYNLACAGGVATAPVWGDAGQAFGVMVLVKETAWSVLQSAGAPTASSATASATFGSNLSAGTKILCFVANNLAVTSVKDTAGNSLTQVSDVADAWSATAGHMSVYAMDTPAGDVGGTTTITVTVGSTSYFGVVIQEVSGLLAGTSGLIDGTAGSITRTAIPNTSPSYSSSAANEYLVGFLGDDGENITGPSAATGYSVDAHSVTGSSDCDCVIAYKNSTGGAESCVFSATGGGSSATSHAVVLLAFQLAGGGPSFTAPPNRPRGQAVNRTPAGLIYV